jgi:hypothetical protein
VAALLGPFFSTTPDGAWSLRRYAHSSISSGYRRSQPHRGERLIDQLHLGTDRNRLLREAESPSSAWAPFWRMRTALVFDSRPSLVKAYVRKNFAKCNVKHNGHMSREEYDNCHE